jgi:hypothetical protein
MADNIFASAIYILVQSGLIAWWVIFVRAGVNLFRANGRIPVGFIKVKYVEPSDKRHGQIFQKTLGGIFIIAGLGGIISSLVDIMSRVFS